MKIKITVCIIVKNLKKLLAIFIPIYVRMLISDYIIIAILVKSW